MNHENRNIHINDVTYIIETKDLCKVYQNHSVVNNLNLHIPKGQIYALLGRNGAGKTTTMKMLLNLVQPSSGKIFLFGKNSSDFNKKNYIGLDQ